MTDKINNILNEIDKDFKPIRFLNSYKDRENSILNIVDLIKKKEFPNIIHLKDLNNISDIHHYDKLILSESMWYLSSDHINAFDCFFCYYLRDTYIPIEPDEYLDCMHNLGSLNPCKYPMIKNFDINNIGCFFKLNIN